MPDEDVQDQQARQVSDLFHKAWADPQARVYLEEGLAKAFPQDAEKLAGRQGRIAANQLMTMVNEKVASVDAKLAELDRKQTHERAQEALRQQGYSSEDIAAVEKLMVDEGIGTHANAALVYRSRSQVAPARSVSTAMHVPGRGQHAATQYFEGIMKDPDGWARNKADEILTEFANGRGDRWLDPSYWPAPRAATA